MQFSRRRLLQSALLSTVVLSGATAAEPTLKRRKIVLRSAWQTVNIGDIAHTPGLLTILERDCPELDVRLWPSKLDRGARELLTKRFPKLEILESEAQIKTALQECEFLLHGSGPSLVGQKEVQRWHTETGKPFGVWGITLPTLDDKLVELLSAASFVYTRDSVSLELAQQKGVKSPVLEFGPDAAFAVDLADDRSAQQFIKQHQLVAGNFVCCIPRLRYTPYWLIKNQPLDQKKASRNEEMREHDHAILRSAIRAVLEQTQRQVLLCPEDMSQMAVGKELLYDKLTVGEQSRVRWREQYWLTDEALSTYRHSAGLFGLEMHSPIMCIGNEIPALVGRFAEQTSKGLMWRDIGLGDWLFDFDQADQVAKLNQTLLAMLQQRDTSLAKVKQAREFVIKKQQAMSQILRKTLAVR